MRREATPREIAEKCLYLDGLENPILPQQNVQRCVMATDSRAADSFQVEGTCFPIDSPTSWTVDQRSVRNPATGRRLMRYRPVFPEWEITFLVTLDEVKLSEQALRQIVETSGRRVGLGDFRAECKGPFGKFIVTNWLRVQPGQPKKQYEWE